MRIERLAIDGYRSIQHLEFSPKTLSVFVGPNNSGKTNILDALSFAADVYQYGPREAIDRRAGFDNISNRGLERAAPGAIRFEVTATGDENDPALEHTYFTERRGLEAFIFEVTHAFELSGLRDTSPTADYVISEEVIRIRIKRKGKRLKTWLHVEQHYDVSNMEGKPQLNRPVVRMTGDRSERAWLIPYFPHTASNFRNLLPTLLERPIAPKFLTADILKRFVPLLQGLLDNIAGTQMYQLMPTECRKPSTPSSQPDLSIHGNNLPTLVYFLQNREPKTWKRIEEQLRRVFPTIETVVVSSTPDRLWTLSFREFGTDETWSANEVSDGTIRMLALLATIYDSRSSLLAIEEPENSLHPWAIRVIIDACREVAEQDFTRQIMISTHSPVLIDYVEPRQLWLVWRRGQASHIGPITALDADAYSLWESGEITIFEILDTGLIPQATPQLEA